ncbi:glycosyl transferase, partial [Streptomyces sp. SID5770]|nr:glycosyl transferase [Streptomyces sp. SID5770]
TGGGAPGLAAALRGLGEARPARLPVPEAARHYDIARSARQLLSLYDQAVPTPSTRVN